MRSHSAFNAALAKAIGADYEEAYDSASESWWAVMNIMRVKPDVCDGVSYACRWDGVTREEAAAKMSEYLLSKKGKDELREARSKVREFEEAT